MSELQSVQDDFSEITGISLWVCDSEYKDITNKSLTVDFLGDDGKEAIEYVCSCLRDSDDSKGIFELSFNSNEIIVFRSPVINNSDIEGYCIGLVNISGNISKSEDELTDCFNLFASIAKSLYVLSIENSGLRNELVRLKEIEKVTEEENARLQHENDYDELTKVHSRSYFFRKVEEADKDESMLPISLVVGDVNNLKFTNDMFGHRHGDWLLCKIAQILQEFAMDNYTVARCGGDEFFILMPNTQRAGANYYCKRVTDRLAKENDTCLPPSISLGSAKKSEMSQSLNRLLEAADAKMYAVKSQFKHKQNQFEAMLKILFDRKFLTCEGINRKTAMVKAFGAELGMDSLKIERCTYLIRYEDIGLCIVPERIYNKDGEYTDREWREIKKHPQLGMKIALINTKIAPISEWMYLTHENYDGSGWPRGIKGEAIPSEVMFVRLVTEFVEKEEKTSTREAYEYIKSQSGIIFEPSLCKKFIDYLEKTESIE